MAARPPGRDSTHGKKEMTVRTAAASVAGWAFEFGVKVEARGTRELP